ncbi:MAG: hypothetical protein HKN90_07685 [Flavobacteriaceae bacterium]|nr:hypothetical protein [Flavobacteriaceae bacterium]
MMKFNKNLMLLVVSIFLSAIVSAQSSDSTSVKTESIEKMRTITTKKYSFHRDGKVIPYELKVLENRNYKLKFKEEDKGKLNQDIVKTPAYVTKLVLIDSDTDPQYDMYLVLRYEKFPSDSFEVVPTEKGFAVKVDKKQLEYIFGEGIYFVNNDDKDFFMIDEFRAI